MKEKYINIGNILFVFVVCLFKVATISESETSRKKTKTNIKIVISFEGFEGFDSIDENQLASAKEQKQRQCNITSIPHQHHH